MEKEKRLICEEREGGGGYYLQTFIRACVSNEA